MKYAKVPIVLVDSAHRFVWSLTSLCHSNGHMETMPAREINPFTALTRIRSQLNWQYGTSHRRHTWRTYIIRRSKEEMIEKLTKELDGMKDQIQKIENIIQPQKSDLKRPRDESDGKGKKKWKIK